MHTFHLATALTDPLSPDWEFLSDNALGEEVHADRKKGFLLSREALRLCLLDFNLIHPVSKLNLISFHQVLGVPKLTVSLSHSKTCGAALVGSREIYRSLGIDIEQENREVKDSIRNRIAHPQDVSLRNIELWCVKEAAFKALMNTDLFEKPIEFNSIQIKKDQWLHAPSGLEGTWEIQNPKPFLLALAFLKN